MILNRGDGVLDASEKKLLANVPPTAPTPFAQEPGDVLKVNVGAGAPPALVIKGAASAVPFMVLKADGTGTPADWEASAPTLVAGAAGEAMIEKMQAVDIDGDGVDEIAVVTEDFVRVYKTTDAGATWAVERTITRTGGSPFSSIHIADIDKDGQKDLVIGKQFGFSQVYWGPDVLPGSTPTLLELTDFGAAGTQISALPRAPSQHTIEEIVLFDEDNNGVLDVIFTTSDGAGDHDTYLTTLTEASIEQRNFDAGISAIESTAVGTDHVESIELVDLNNDGAKDLIYAFKKGPGKIILSTVAPRTDLSSLDPIEELIEELNPSTLQVKDGASSTDGAWVESQGLAGTTEVPQVGLGQIDTDASTHTTTIGAPVSPTDPSVVAHGPPCALPGSNVVPVEVEFCKLHNYRTHAPPPLPSHGYILRLPLWCLCCAQTSTFP